MGLLFDLRRIAADVIGRPLSQREERQLGEGLRDAVDEITDDEGNLLPDDDGSPDAQLRSFMRADVGHVRLLSMREPDTCPTCYDADGTELKLAKALREMPLPHADCTCADGCGCVYLPIIKD